MAAASASSSPTTTLVAAAAPLVTAQNESPHVTPLHRAASQGLEVMVQALLGSGADTGALATDGYCDGTPLHWAARAGHVEVARALWTAGAAVDDARTLKGHMPMHVAARHGHATVVQALLAGGADKGARVSAVDTPSSPTAGDAECEAPLHLAAQRGHIAVVQVLVAAGADTDARTRCGATPLHWAAKHGHDEVARALLAAGACVDAQDSHRATPLHWAAEYGEPAVATVLVTAGADVEAHASHNATPLHWAAEHGQEAVATVLLRAGASTEARTLGRCETPLHLTAKHGQSGVAQLLVTAGADTESLCLQFVRITPLHWAVDYGHTAVIKVLLDAHADLEARDQCGRTPLRRAANPLRASADGLSASDVRKQALEMSVFLVAAGSNPAARASLTDGTTPIHDAVYQGDTALVCFLLACTPLDTTVDDLATWGPGPAPAFDWTALARDSACEHMLKALLARGGTADGPASLSVFDADGHNDLLVAESLRRHSARPFTIDDVPDAFVPLLTNVFWRVDTIVAYWGTRRWPRSAPASCTSSSGADDATSLPSELLLWRSMPRNVVAEVVELTCDLVQLHIASSSMPQSVWDRSPLA